MKNAYRAFSLLEVLVVIALLSVLSATYWGSGLFQYYQSSQQSQSLTQQSHTLLSAIDRARTLAVVSGRSVYLCGGEQCDGHWSEALYLAYSTEQPPLWRRSLAANVRVVWHGFPQQRNYVAFLPTGLASYQNGSFYLCVENSPAQRVIINQSGRAYLDTQSYPAGKCL